MPITSITDKSTKGHEQRTALLVRGISEILPYSDDIVVVDIPNHKQRRSIAKEYNSEDKFVVCVVDSHQDMNDLHLPANVVVFGSLAKGRPLIRREESRKVIAGYPLVNPLFSKHSWEEPLRNGYVGLITGSNSREFYEQVNKNAIPHAEELKEWCFPEELIGFLMGAKYVIVAAGMTALEINAVGCPMLLVQTSNDQLSNIQALMIGAGCSMYGNELKPQKSIIPPDSVGTVARATVESYLEWRMRK